MYSTHVPTELRILVLGVKTCRQEVGPCITIPVGGCFSEHVKFDLDSMHLLCRFHIDRLSDLGLDGFDKLCRTARLLYAHTRKSMNLRGNFSEVSMLWVLSNKVQRDNHLLSLMSLAMLAPSSHEDI